MSQDLIASVLVAAAVLYLTWRWLPLRWRNRLRGVLGSQRHEDRPETLASREAAQTGGCAACRGCGEGACGSAPVPRDLGL